MEGGLGKIFWSLNSNPITFLTLLSTFCIFSWKSSFEFIKCFWISDWLMLIPMNLKEGRCDFWSLQENVIYCACLLTHFMPLISSDTPWKHQKPEVFWYFQGASIEIMINVRVETQFPLESPVSYFFQVINEVNHRLVYAMHKCLCYAGKKQRVISK